MANQVMDVAMSLNFLPCKKPRLVTGLLIAYPAGATQHGSVERQDAGALEELQAYGAVHQRFCPASISQKQQQPRPAR